MEFSNIFKFLRSSKNDDSQEKYESLNDDQRVVYKLIEDATNNSGSTDKLEASSTIESYFKNKLIDDKDVTIKVHNIFKDIPGPGSTTNNLLKNIIHEEVNNKSELMARMDSIRDYDYIETALRDVATDVLTRSYDPEKTKFIIFQDKSGRDDVLKLEDSINTDIERLKLYRILNDIMEDLLLYGQYVFKMDYKNDELDDGLIQEMVLPAYSKGSIVKIGYTEDSLSGELFDSKDFLTLTLFTSHKRTKVKDSNGSYYWIKLPRGIIPKSIIPKIMNLKILEYLQPLIEIQSVDEKTYYHIRFPPGKDVADAFQECRDYERFLKSLLSLGSVNNVDDLMDKVSTIKVIPLFGNQNEMTAQSVQKFNKIDLSQINDLRESISYALKIKINDDNSSNFEYYKLIKRIRNLIRLSLHEFFVNYINRKYKNKLTKPINYEDFSIILPDVQGVEDLDTIDYINMFQSTYKDMMELVASTNSSITDLEESRVVNKEKYINYLSSNIQKMLGAKIIKSFDELELTSTEDPKDHDDSNDPADPDQS